MEHQQHWEGKVQANLSRATADEAWTLLKQFSNLHIIFPSIATCRLIDGVDGTPGCIRHVSVSPGGGGTAASWAREKLTSIDHAGRRLSYEVTESNMGFGKYVAVMTVSEGTGPAGRGCTIEWRFDADPVAGMTRDDLVSYLENGIENIGRKIEEFSGEA